MIELDIVTEAGDWPSAGELAGLLGRAAEAAIAALPDPPAGPASATLLLADDRAVRELNRTWRGQDKPTNVLSFPAVAPANPDGPAELGDIVLAYETVAREAAEEGKGVADHAAHLVVHGVLHLLGFDHRDDREADAMERLEISALAGLGIPDPYGSGDRARDDAAACAP